ncbi:hypothetical protein A3K72_02660 [Candidatus Woesearchaeota archaeon RBG_13_36_6]|nr:MAG: hypothetical protein A3K72_02660 [Candidatus Woesearchaeota archaeon RBG_13_36_6]
MDQETIYHISLKDRIFNGIRNNKRFIAHQTVSFAAGVATGYVLDRCGISLESDPPEFFSILDAGVSVVVASAISGLDYLVEKTIKREKFSEKQKDDLFLSSICSIPIYYTGMRYGRLANQITQPLYG